MRQRPEDSFLIQLQIDTTTKAQTVLTANAFLTWQTNSISAAQKLVVGNFARLTLTDTTTAPSVGSGRLLNYQLIIANTGNCTIRFDHLGRFHFLKWHIRLCEHNANVRKSR